LELPQPAIDGADDEEHLEIECELHGMCPRMVWGYESGSPCQGGSHSSASRSGSRLYAPLSEAPVQI
jgi:hypothetical protein